jgi:HK97 family phage portal protein
MGLFKRAGQILGGLFGANPQSPPSYPIITSWLQAGAVSATGVTVTPETAMAAAAVFACVDVISSSLATVPIKVIDKQTKKEVPHQASEWLNDEPNADMTAAQFRQTFAMNLCLWGNGYAFIQPDGPDAGLYPLRASTCSPQRWASGPLYYKAITGNNNYTFDPSQVLHVPDITYEGVSGLPRTRYASNSIGLALALESFASRFFANGGNLGGFLQLPPGMKKDAVDAFVQSWRREYVGLDNSFKTGLLTDGMTYTKTGTDPRNAQMIDGRLFQVREICRIYRVPPHMVCDLEHATFSNIEQQGIDFVQNCIRPWAVKHNQEYARKLLSESEKKRLAIVHDLTELYSADTQTRYAAYNQALQAGWQTRNEIRARENMPPMEGGDQPLQPLNMGNPGGNPDATKEPPENQPPTKPPASQKTPADEEDDKD